LSPIDDHFKTPFKRNRFSFAFKKEDDENHKLNIDGNLTEGSVLENEVKYKGKFTSFDKKFNFDCTLKQNGNIVKNINFKANEHVGLLLRYQKKEKKQQIVVNKKKTTLKQVKKELYIMKI